MNSSNGGPTLSPKKKLHLKAKNSLADTVKYVQNDLKNAKDISARNLLAHHTDTSSGSSIGDSSLEEVVVIEEETTDYVSETERDEEHIEEEEYYEEILEDSDTDDSELEPLPPPIEIPDALKVKDSDDEAASDKDSDSDSDLTDEEEERKGFAATAGQGKGQQQRRRVLSHDPNHTRPNTVRGPSCYSTKSSDTASMEEDEPAVATVPQANSMRPTKYRGLSYLKEDKPTKPQPKEQMETFEESDDDDEPETAHHPVVAVPKTPTRTRTLVPTTPKTPTTSYSTIPVPHFSSPVVDDDGRPDVSWKKPDWTKNTKLRPTGKSAAENLAKPITNLPHMLKKENCCDDDDRKPAAVTKKDRCTSSSTEVMIAATLSPGVPAKPIKPYASLHQTPTKTPKAKVKKHAKTTVAASKSAPTTPVRCNNKVVFPAPPVAAAADDETLPAIGWEKPEWTKTKVLRGTSKGEKLKSGQRLERPIGGIKPVDD
jgi:hypothetical protein